MSEHYIIKCNCGKTLYLIDRSNMWNDSLDLSSQVKMLVQEHTCKQKGDNVDDDTT